MSKANCNTNKKNDNKSGNYKRRRSNSRSQKGNREDTRFRGSDSIDKDIEDQRSGNGSPIINNAGMYFKDKQLAEMVTNFSFNQYLGSDMYDSRYPHFKVPNVMVYFLNPSPGWLDGNVSEGINAMALKMYTLLSANNAKTTSYGPQDISTLVLAMGQLIAMTEHARRILGCAYLYSIRNRFIPRGLINAMGIDSDDLFNSLAQYRIKFNTLVNRMNAIPMVSNIEYFKKSYEIYRHVYTDTESPMCQYYVVVPFSTWTVDESSYEGGTVLRTTQVIGNSGPLKFSGLLQILEDMLKNLMESSTFNFIYSDILRLNKADWTFQLCSEDYTCMPEYNPMMCLQLMNATILGNPIANPQSMKSTLAGERYFGDYTTGNDVYPVIGSSPSAQSSNSLRYNPLFVVNSAALEKPRLINFPESTGNPDLDQRCDATRYVAIFKHCQAAYEGANWYNGDQSATDIVNAAVIPDYYVVAIEAQTYVGNKIDPTLKCYLPVGNVIKVRPEYSDNNIPAVKQAVMMSNFRFAPIMMYDESTQTGQEMIDWTIGACGELDFFTFIDYNYLQPVNDLAMQGLFEMTK